MLATLLLFMVLIVTQLGAAIARHYWLPLGLSAQYLWLGLLLIGAWYGQGVWQRRHQVVSRELGALKKIGRASCRERRAKSVTGGSIRKKKRDVKLPQNRTPI